MVSPLTRTTLFVFILPCVTLATFDAQTTRCASGGAGRCVEVLPPFAEAALWAASLIPEACDSQSEVGCRWQSVGPAWRYAWNNLRLAVEAADDGYKGQIGPEVHEQLSAIHGFIDQLQDESGLWYGNWAQASGAARGLIEFLRPWLDAKAYQSGPPLLVPKANHGLRVPTPGRSVHLPSDGSDPVPRVALGNGVEMPVLGFGVWQLKAETGSAYQSVRWALEAGYRHIDTAQGYKNEEEVGRALQDSGVPRGEIFLVTKLSKTNEYGAATRARFDAQLRALGVDYVDLYMLHSPGDADGRKAAWRELEALYDEGRVRALGLSNFDIEQLTELYDFARVKPVYLQNKYSVYQPGDEFETRKTDWIMEWIGAHGIVMMGYSVIRPGHYGLLSPLDDPHVAMVAQRLQRTPSQVMHRWLLQLGGAVIPSSSNRERIAENARLFDFYLSEAEMRMLNGLSSLVGSSPGRRAPAWCEDVYGLSRLSTGE